MWSSCMNSFERACADHRVSPNTAYVAHFVFNEVRVVGSLTQLYEGLVLAQYLMQDNNCVCIGYFLRRGRLALSRSYYKKDLS